MKPNLNCLSDLGKVHFDSLDTKNLFSFDSKSGLYKG